MIILTPFLVVTATYDFNGVEEKHISFKSGTRIEVLEKQDEWWQGRINGQVGWFPSRYAEDPKPTPTQTQTKKITATKKAPPPPGAIGKLSASGAPPPKPPPPQMMEPEGTAMKAAYDFEGQQDTDLR